MHHLTDLSDFFHTKATSDAQAEEQGTITPVCNCSWRYFSSSASKCLGTLRGGWQIGALPHVLV